MSLRKLVPCRACGKKFSVIIDSTGIIQESELDLETQLCPKCFQREKSAKTLDAWKDKMAFSSLAVEVEL